MSTYETVSVPFKLSGNVQILTDQQISEQPWLAEFIVQFPNCFERDDSGCFYRFYPTGKDAE